jgi:hypothetical protein
MHQPACSSPRILDPVRFLDRIRAGLRWRLSQMLRQTNPRPVRIDRMASPLVRLLEPRLVLDASAVLNEMGQLLVTGSPVESVQLQVDSNGQL